MDEAPEFERAVERLRRFLGEQSWPTRIIWRDESELVRTPSGRILVRRRPAREAADSARAQYEAWRGREVGVALVVHCEVDGAACTTIEGTTDRLDAERRLLPETGLKLSVVVHRPPSRTVGALRWWLATRMARTRLELLPPVGSARAAGDPVEPDGSSGRG